VGSIAWNTSRHMELYFGISCKGAVLNTINPRLFAEQMIYIVNHAENQFLFVDLTFVPALEQLQDKMPNVKGFIILTDQDHMPDTSLRNVHCYEDLIAPEDDHYDWPEFDENAAAVLCYTSGTTGDPKGVLYSHRSTVLHAYATCMKDSLDIGNGDSVLPIVPMFHVNAWGMPYTCAMSGAKMVMPGAGMDGESIYNLMRDEGVTIALGVPTVWLALLQHANSLDADSTKLAVKTFVIGGAAASESLINGLDSTFGATALHAWGMTETSPLGSTCRLTPDMADASAEDQMTVRLKQGRPPFGVDLKIVDDEGNELPRDGKAFGRLMIRGNWVTSGYFKGAQDVLDDEGYFDTGDVSTIDDKGYMNIVDRSKDVIKSGGEWISSIDLENVAIGHADVAEAAVIAVAHKKWQERPLLVCVLQPGASLTKDDMLAYMDGKIAKWWMPDDVVFLDELPHTATGKIHKLVLREQFKDMVLG